jgi:plastocyanin
MRTERRSDPIGAASRIHGVRIKSLIIPAAVAVVVAAVALALGHSRGGSTGAQSTAVVLGKTARLTIANYAFAPKALTVRAGTTVTVVNTDNTAHTATASLGAFDSGTLKPGQSTHFTVNKPGTYAYICQFHAFMTGTIDVIR